ncbi:MAG: UDP-glucose 4-epimerase [Ilumatobacteraceae bacterium]|nr:UDP-glucose 4-epimerase [Ilumatobacteraceae bacterium]
MTTEAQGRDRTDLRATTCVVTGGMGFIGSNLVHALVAQGASVRVVDALVPSHGGDARNVAGLGVEALVARIGDDAVADVLAGADVVFNLAGQVSHTASMADPLLDLELNAMDHARFLETVRRVNPSVRVVHASTRQVYGRVAQLPADESTAANPVDVNGVAKLAGEQLHMVHAQAYGLPTTSLRLSNVYGPRQRLTSNELGFLPVFVRKALRHEVIEIFGDGSQRRDCLHVDDVVDALLTATADTAVGRVYNVGSRNDNTLSEIAEMISSAAESDAGVRYVAWPADHERIDIGSFTTNSHRFAHELGWASSTDFADGAKQTVSFYRENPWYLSST